MDLFTFPVQEMLETQDKGNLEENAEKVPDAASEDSANCIKASNCFSHILTMFRHSEIIKGMAEQEENGEILFSRTELR